jgi:hypothetical protein
MDDTVAEAACCVVISFQKLPLANPLTSFSNSAFHAPLFTAIRMADVLIHLTASSQPLRA